MKNHDENLDQRFYEFIFNHEDNRTVHLENNHLINLDLDPQILKHIFLCQIHTRNIDLKSRELERRGDGFYSICSAGHESNAAIAAAIGSQSPAFLHYRSIAFCLYRSGVDYLENQVRQELRSIMASSKDAVSGGRHRLIANLEKNIYPQTSIIASQLPKAVGYAFGLSLKASEQIDHNSHRDEVVICSFGDGSLNHSTAQGALNLASYLSYKKNPLPIIFICEDNGVSLSMDMDHEWIKASVLNRPAIEYIECDGSHLLDCYQKASEAYHIAYSQKRPVFLHMSTVRLLGHTGLDIEEQYHTPQFIADCESRDPLLKSAALMINAGIYSPVEVSNLYTQSKELINVMEKEILMEGRLSRESSTKTLVPNRIDDHKLLEKYGQKLKHAHERLAKRYQNLEEPRHLAACLNIVLHEVMDCYSAAHIFGEDVAKKGGVYQITKNLANCFGPSRVFDTLLDEQSILGTAVGLSMQGLLPIPEIQFLAYYHNAADQLRAEAAMLPFLSNGQLSVPMVIRIPAFSQERGIGGHFHNENTVAALRDIPGIVIATCSRGDEGVKIFRHLFELAYIKGQICVFLEPTDLYFKLDSGEDGDRRWLSVYPKPADRVALGEVAVHYPGASTVLVSYANGFYRATVAAEKLKRNHGIETTLIDLRWLHPLPIDALMTALEGASEIILVDECRRTGSVSESLVAEILMESDSNVRLEALYAKDSFIPLGPAASYMVPSVDDIIQAVLSMREKYKNK